MCRKSEPWSLSMGIFMLTVGFVLGSIFIFGEFHWHSAVDREDCRVIHTSFVSYRERSSMKHPFDALSITVCCADRKEYTIDGSLCSNSLAKEISQIGAGEELTFMLHPNSDTVLGLAAGDRALLPFRPSMDVVEGEVTGFFFLGMFMYFCGAMGLSSVIWRLVKNRRSRRK